MIFNEIYRFPGEIETDHFTVLNSENTNFGYILLWIVG